MEKNHIFPPKGIFLGFQMIDHAKKEKKGVIIDRAGDIGLIMNTFER